MSNEYNRRQFLDLAVLGAAGMATAFSTRAAADTPSERVVIGVMGLSRGRALASTFAKLPNVEVRYVCDADSDRARACANMLAEEGAPGARPIGDFRQILDDGEVDALVCAAPNHWHAPATILACSAGKHVYIEKPASHNPREGELMVEAARKHGRVVQVGMQRRSSPQIRAAIELLHAGEIGRVYSARATYASRRGSLGHGQPAEVPARLDYEIWQGPAPRKPYLDNRVHYNWHWFWHWGNGELGNNGVHTLDLCRWGLQVDHPAHVTSSGGRFVFEDDQETPDTHTVGFTFDDKKMITWQSHSCNPHAQDFVNFYGETGTLKLESRGNYVVYNLDNEEIHREEDGVLGDSEHAADFLAAVRSGDAMAVHSEVDDARRSALLCHLGNIAHRTGRALHCDTATGHIVEDAEAMAFWAREYEPGWEPVV